MMQITFEPSITLGSIFHLVLLLACIYYVTGKAIRRLQNIETKLDALQNDLRNKSQ